MTSKYLQFCPASVFGQLAWEHINSFHIIGKYSIFFFFNNLLLGVRRQAEVERYYLLYLNTEEKREIGKERRRHTVRQQGLVDLEAEGTTIEIKKYHDA